jgi:hypothetical protein
MRVTKISFLILFIMYNNIMNSQFCYKNGYVITNSNVLFMVRLLTGDVF